MHPRSGCRRQSGASSKLLHFCTSHTRAQKLATTSGVLQARRDKRDKSNKARKQTLEYEEDDGTETPADRQFEPYPELPEPPYSMPSTSSNLFEKQWGLAVVRQQVSYSELLRDIRESRVKAVRWFSFDDSGPRYTPGNALVEYLDGRVRQTYIPPADYRCWNQVPRACLLAHSQA